MRGKYQTVVFIVFLLHFHVCEVLSDEESSEEKQPNYEYIQIFKSIPALFEYLLDALEERPEILEKNDVTMFKRNIDPETDESETFDNEKKTNKRAADCDNPKTQDENGFKNVNKRDDDVSRDVSETTVAYEYGNSNVVMTGLDELESDKIISERAANNDEKTRINKDGVTSDRKMNTLFKLDDEVNDLLRNYGEVFLGFEHLFGLDVKPEEIEERIVTAEKLLEEHNTKKDDK